MEERQISGQLLVLIADAMISNLALVQSAHKDDVLHQVFREISFKLAEELVRHQHLFVLEPAPEPQCATLIRFRAYIATRDQLEQLVKDAYLAGKGGGTMKVMF